MSGGSYDYLYSKDVQDLFYMYGSLQSMANRLARFGYAQDAARETQEILVMLRDVETKISVMQNRLSDIWRAVEWLDSGDGGEDAVKKALDGYRHG